MRKASVIVVALGVVAAVWAAPDNKPREVWVGLREDGKAGTGTLGDPFDGRGVEKLNALFDKFVKEYGDNLTVHFGPGIYEGDHLIAPANNWHILGAGMDITTFRTRANPNAIDAFGFRAGGYTGGPYGFLAQDFTVDFNVLNLRRPNRAFLYPDWRGQDVAYVYAAKLPDWAADATYALGKMVRFRGQEYMALKNSKGKEPAQGEFWSALRAWNPAELPAWDAAKGYVLGEGVAKGKVGYLCIADSKGNDPASDETHWKAIDPDAPDPDIWTHAVFVHAKPPQGHNIVRRVKAINGNGAAFFGREGFMIGLGGDDCLIEDCVVEQFRGSYGSLMILDFGQHGVIRGCTVRGNADKGGTMTMAYGGWAVWDAVYEDNFCSNVSAANNIDSLRCRNVTYRGNVFMNCKYVGILVNVGNGIVGGLEQYTMPIDGVDVTDWARSSMDGLFIYGNLVQMQDGAPYGAIQTQQQGLRNVQIHDNVLRTTSGHGKARAIGVLGATNGSVHGNVCEPGMYAEFLPAPEGAATWYDNLDLLGQPMKNPKGQPLPARKP